jgi:hypothetical protein
LLVQPSINKLAAHPWSTPHQKQIQKQNNKLRLRDLLIDYGKQALRSLNFNFFLYQGQPPAQRML